MFYKQLCQVRPKYEEKAAESRLWVDSLPAGEQKANDRDQRLATLDFPSGPILSRVRCIALLASFA
jgi:hypothetical protein